jgi:hypothetical protein
LHPFPLSVENIVNLLSDDEANSRSYSSSYPSEWILTPFIINSNFDPPALWSSLYFFFYTLSLLYISKLLFHPYADPLLHTESKSESDSFQLRTLTLLGWPKRENLISNVYGSIIWITLPLAAARNYPPLLYLAQRQNLLGKSAAGLTSSSNI